MAQDKGWVLPNQPVYSNSTGVIGPTGSTGCFGGGVSGTGISGAGPNSYEHSKNTIELHIRSIIDPEGKQMITFKVLRDKWISNIPYPMYGAPINQTIEQFFLWYIEQYVAHTNIIAVLQELDQELLIKFEKMAILR